MNAPDEYAPPGLGFLHLGGHPPERKLNSFPPRKKRRMVSKSNWPRRAAISLASLVTLGTVGIAGLGYGVSLAIESTFSLPGAVAFSSTLDLLDFAKFAIAELLPITAALLDIHAYVNRWLGNALILSILTCMVWAVLSWRHITRIQSGKPTAFQRPRIWSRGIRLPDAEDSAAVVASSFLVPAAAPFAAIGAIYAGLFLICASAVVLTVVPYLGLKLGQTYVRDYVIAPASCEPLPSRAALLRRMQQGRSTDYDQKETPVAPTAACVRVSRDGHGVSGRVVIASTSAIVLYDPATGAATRIPLEEANVETIGTL